MRTDGEKLSWSPAGSPLKGQSNRSTNEGGREGGIEDRACGQMCYVMAQVMQGYRVLLHEDLKV